MPDAASFHLSCPICSQLTEEESAYQKYGAEEGNTYLPQIWKSLSLVIDFRPGSSRKMQLYQCPECYTYYLYQTDYEYLVNGSEDEEHLKRLSDQEAADYLEPGLHI